MPVCSVSRASASRSPAAKSSRVWPVPRVEAQPVLLDHHPAVVQHQAELREGRLHVGGQTPGPVEGGPHLPHAGPALQQLHRGAGRDQLAEADPARILAQESQTAQLGAPLGGQPQEPRQLAQREHPLGRTTSA